VPLTPMIPMSFTENIDFIPKNKEGSL